MNALTACFAGARVLVTGHTGFKGSWLCAWLAELGAQVTGFADGLVSTPSHFELAGLAERVSDRRGDIRDAQALHRVVADCQPQFVFHLAAQPLVGRSHREPALTFETNLMGTVNVLEALRDVAGPCTAVLVTSDKSYDNQEWVWGYRETDLLGGKDPYSGSKGAAELAIRSYLHSYFPDPHAGVRLGVGRAGNVIGGGDWSADRLVPDCVRAWLAGEAVPVRRPQATRPWQHVLEPLSGYLALAARLAAQPELHGEAFNFGPPADQQHTVGELIDAMAAHWPNAAWQDISQASAFPAEAQLLHLNCDKALAKLGWRASLAFPETVEMTAGWYRRYEAEGGAAVAGQTEHQIAAYQQLARQRGISWAQPSSSTASG